MVVAVTGDLMAGRSNRPQQLGLPLGNPPQHEKRGPHLMPFQKRQQAMRADLHPGREMLPVARGNAIGESGHMEVIFHVDGEGVQHVRFKRLQVTEKTPLEAESARGCSALPEARGIGDDRSESGRGPARTGRNRHAHRHRMEFGPIAG